MAIVPIELVMAGAARARPNSQIRKQTAMEGHTLTEVMFSGVIQRVLTFFAFHLAMRSLDKVSTFLWGVLFQ